MSCDGRLIGPDRIVPILSGIEPTSLE